MEKYNISKNPESNKIINNIVDELKNFSDGLINRINKLTNIGIALSSVKDTPKLLEMIVDFAREFTSAEGGSLYIVSHDKKEIRFEVLQNTKLNVRMGGTAGKITWSAVKLFDANGVENHHNVSAHVALTGSAVNIPDVYDVLGYDFSGTKEFDKKNEYRSKSMLVVPLKDHENEIIGVLQLLNAKSFIDDSVIPFSSETQYIVYSLASQAAVTLTQNKLINDLEALFNSVIKTIAKAVDEKSPYTSGHIKRVSTIVMMIANKINEKKDGVFASVKFSNDELKELLTASWMHDIGKITTPEFIMDKATKLEKIYDRIEEIKTRFEVLKNTEKVKFLNNKISLIITGSNEDISKIEAVFNDEIKKIDDDLSFIIKTNIGGEFLSAESVNRLKKIAERKWFFNGEEKSLISDEELYNLSIPKGTLTNEEKEKMQDHVKLTEIMLNEIPFPSKLKNVPQYASTHHETLDGSGYPKGLNSEQLPVQSRILAIADIFEALSAPDRPYKKGKTISEIKKILDSMVEKNLLDKDIYELFINEKIFRDYVKLNFFSEQIDMQI